MAEEKKAPADAEAKKPAAKKTAASKSKADTAEKKPAAKKPAAKKSEGSAKKSESSTSSSSATKKPAAKSGASASSASKSSASKSASAKKSSGASASEQGEKVSSLKMHHLRPAKGAHTPKTRVGRGEGSKGKTAGRGTKGTGARYQVPERFEGGQTPIHMRIPKLRGFKSPFKIQYQVVNLDQIAALFPKGGKITKQDLIEKGAVRKNRPVKVLGDGDIDVKVTLVDADKVSQSAKTKIEAAGGSVNEG